MNKKRLFTIIFSIMFITLSCSCTPKQENKSDVQNSSEIMVKRPSEANNETELKIYFNEKEIPVFWEENESVAALKQKVADNPLTIEMSKYGGFEQVGSFPFKLPSNDKQITTEIGDIMLYNDSNLVVFYGSNSWDYTRLGKIKDKTEQEIIELINSDNLIITIKQGE